MKACVSSKGHLWTSRDPEAVWGDYPTTEFHGHESVLVHCERPGCDETGYRVREVAQFVSQEGIRA